MSKCILLLVLCFLESSLFCLADPTPTPTPTAPASPIPLDPLLEQTDLWQTPGRNFVANYGTMGFHWLSSTQDSAESTTPGLVIFGIPVNQAVARFKQGRLSEIIVVIFNRGDSGELAKEDFEALGERCTNAISDFTKVPPAERGKDASSAVKTAARIWQTGKSRFLLENSFTKTPSTFYRAEFVRLTIDPVQQQRGLLEKSLATFHPAAKFSGLDHLEKDPNGDVFIKDVPMVDQGAKGYCVVASAERVIRYYGGRADANELAEIANTSALQGTSVPAMLDSLKKLTARLHIKVRTLDNFDEPELRTLVGEYNQLAHRGQRGVEIRLTGRELSLSGIFEQMNPEILREAKTRNPAAMNRFLRLVEAHISLGIPLMWSVMVGVLPQPKDPKGFGGHMRLIIGCNSKTNEIVYSDSWGIGHELKRMPLSDAWTMTTGLYAIEPL